MNLFENIEQSEWVESVGETPNTQQSYSHEGPQFFDSCVHHLNNVGKVGENSQEKQKFEPEKNGSEREQDVVPLFWGRHFFFREFVRNRESNCENDQQGRQEVNHVLWLRKVQLCATFNLEDFKNEEPEGETHEEHFCLEGKPNNLPILRLILLEEYEWGPDQEEQQLDNVRKHKEDPNEPIRLLPEAIDNLLNCFCTEKF